MRRLIYETHLKLSCQAQSYRLDFNSMIINEIYMDIKLHIYPDGRADSLPLDYIVSKLNSRGRLEDCYVADLLDGDKYALPYGDKLPPRKDRDVIAYIAEKKLSFDWKEKHLFVMNEFGDPLVDYPIYEDSDPYDTIREAVDAIIDQDEL